MEARPEARPASCRCAVAPDVAIRVWSTAWWECDLDQPHGAMRVRSIETQGALPGDVTIHVKLRLSSLWVSVMLCYIYGEIFRFFKPGTLKDILAGNMGPSDRREACWLPRS